ncbi:apolipoprotein N-acyltransferase [Marivivens marinus]|uniref:apolipoprotein N-acyltransferase n=1 Tax=Marivivens marinus TaxID=3110173 RepID=UPI003B84AD63
MLPNSGWRRLAAFAVLGAVAALGQAPWGLWWLTLPALAAAVVWMRPTGWGAAWDGWALGTGYFGTALHWIVFPFFVEPDIHGWMAPFAVVFMAAGLALFWALASGIAARFRMGRAGVLALLAGAEVCRAYIFTGFPWANIGHIWIDTPLAQLAAIAGPHGLILLTTLLVWGLTTLWDGRRVIGGAVVLGGAVAAFALSPGAAPAPDASAPVVRLVQPNAPQDEKWDPDLLPVFYNRLITATGQGQPPALVVWPETAIPYLMEYADPIFSEVGEAARGAPVILGLNRRDGARYYNALAVLGLGGEVRSIYDKRHLVPFGEYIPFGEVIGRFGLRGLAASEGGGFSKGQGVPRILLPGLGQAVPLICYEGIFAEEVRAAVIAGDRPRLLVLITNDAWFGPGTGPRQHLAQARLRAIETGLPMVRVANTGVSAMIDGRGRITDSLPMNVDGWIDAPLPADLGPTPYLSWGDIPALLLLILAISGVILGQRRFSIDPVQPDQ